MFAGLAWGAGYLDSIPNFEFLTVILFVGGFVLGPAWGALAAALGEFLYSAMNPYGSGLAVPLVLAAQTAGMACAGMACAGATGGFVGRLTASGHAPRGVVVIASGIAVTLVFDLLTNLASAVLFGPIVPTLLAGLPFAAIHVGTNAALFALVGVPLVAALERTRRSLTTPVALAAFVLTAFLAAAAWPDAVAAQEPVDSVAAAARAGFAVIAPIETPSPAPTDSTDLVHGRRAPPPRWGDGPAALKRRSDGTAAVWLTREGAMTERFADDRGSAEPLSRFGLPGARLELDWLGLPAAAPGAVGGAPTRIPFAAVGSVEAPRLPVSARAAFRGEVGEARFLPHPATAGHARVIGWAGLGSHQHRRSGFLATGTAGAAQGLVAVESQGLGPLAPLGPEGDHSIAGAFRRAGARLALEAAYRSARENVEDDAGVPDVRAGSAGRVRARLASGAAAYDLSVERTAERASGGDFFVGDTLAQEGKTARVRLEASLPLRGGRGWLAATWGRETLESSGAIAFARRSAQLGWFAAGWDGALGGGGTRVNAALGAGRYGDGDAVVAPSLLLERDLEAGTRAWAGVGRGVGARLDPRAVDDVDDPVVGDPPALASSTWLGGVGLDRRSAAEEAGGSAHGGWARGEHRLRAALYAGRSTPGLDPAREPFATDALRATEAAVFASATRFVALVATAAIAPLGGVRLEVGGHALGRTVDPVVRLSDPDWRVSGEIEARRAFLHGDLDLRVGAIAEALGPRPGTPAGDLPSAARVGLFAGFALDDFLVRAELRDVAGSNRFLPVIDPATDDPRVADTSRFVLLARWTFWD